LYLAKVLDISAKSFFPKYHSPIFIFKTIFFSWNLYSRMSRCYSRHVFENEYLVKNSDNFSA